MTSGAEVPSFWTSAPEIASDLHKQHYIAPVMSGAELPTLSGEVVSIPLGCSPLSTTEHLKKSPPENLRKEWRSEVKNIYEIHPKRVFRCMEEICGNMLISSGTDEDACRSMARQCGWSVASDDFNDDSVCPIHREEWGRGKPEYWNYREYSQK